MKKERGGSVASGLRFLLFLIVFLAIAGYSVAAVPPDSGQVSCYDGIGSMIGCPPPEAPLSQDASYFINWPSFSPGAPGTVLDDQTGLEWQEEDDNTTRTWDQAQTYCGALSLGGSSDWRLPEKRELLSIPTFEIFGPAINQGAFPNTDSAQYWTATVGAQAVDFTQELLLRDGFR